MQYDRISYSVQYHYQYINIYDIYVYMNDDTVSGNSIHDLKWYETYVPYCKGHVLWAVGHNHLNRVIHMTCILLILSVVCTVQ